MLDRLTSAYTIISNAQTGPLLPTCDVIAVKNPKPGTKVVKTDNINDELPERVTDRQPSQPEMQRRQAACVRYR